MESLSHEGLAGDFGGFIHLEVSGGVDEPDGHCHDDVVVVGAGVVAGNLQFGLLEEFGVGVDVEVLGFNATLFGQLNFRPAGILALYLGGFNSGAGSVELVAADELVGGCGPFLGLGGVDVAVVVGVLRSEAFLGATLL